MVKIIYKTFHVLYLNPSLSLLLNLFIFIFAFYGSLKVPKKNELENFTWYFKTLLDYGGFLRLKYKVLIKTALLRLVYIKKT